MKIPQFVKIKKKKAECYITSMEIYTSKDSMNNLGYKGTSNKSQR